MKRLYLFRHGEPEGDYPQRFLGYTNPGLSARGRQQAEMIRSSYPELAGLQVWTSPLLRALQTCEIGFPRAISQVQPLLMERHFGVLEDLLPETALRLYPEAVGCLWSNPLSFVPKGGEGWADLRERARKFLTLLTDHTNVVVSHQYIVMALTSDLTREPVANLLTLPLDYGQCLILTLQDSNDRWILQEGKT